MSVSAAPTAVVTKMTGPTIGSQSVSSRVASVSTRSRYAPATVVADTTVATTPHANTACDSWLRSGAKRASETWRPSPDRYEMNRIDVKRAVARPTSSVVSMRAATSQKRAPVSACTAAPTTSAADPASR